MKRLIKYSIHMMVILMVTSSCVVQESVITGSKRAYGYSWEQEVSIGNEVDKEIVAEFGIYEDNSLNEYIVNMSEEVLQNSHMRAEDTPAKYRETEFTFRILDSPVINAFALPGGFVYVTRGLMAHMNNEAQIAVVIGHEIGHVAARHASQRGFQQTVGQIVVIGGAVLGQELLGLPGETILNLSGQAAQLIFLSYSRSHERESDQLGVEYAAKTGFAAEEGAAFFTSLKRISDNSGQSLPNLLSTHPDPGERERQIPIMAEEWREKGFTQTVRNSKKYLDMIDGMIFGDNPRNGFEENSTFYHPDMKFRFPIPNGWQMVNQPSQVILISPEKDAVMILRIDSESATARESVQKFLQNNEIETSDQGSTTTSSGFPSYRANFTVTDGDNQLGVHLYALEYEGNIFRFLNYTELSKLDAYRSDFTTTTHAFDRLTDQRILNTKPVRLQVVRVANNRTFRDLLPQNLPMNITPEELAIVNQVYLDDVIEAGSYIKIPVQ